jgi:hypothetical protein
MNPSGEIQSVAPWLCRLDGSQEVIFPISRGSARRIRTFPLEIGILFFKKYLKSIETPFILKKESKVWGYPKLNVFM